jgi:hypothetical protein
VGRSTPFRSKKSASEYKGLSGPVNLERNGNEKSRKQIKLIKLKKKPTRFSPMVECTSKTG